MKFKFIVISILLIANSVFSQQRKLIKADKKYDNLAYIDAVQIYKKVAKKGFKSVDLFEKLGNSYYFNANFEESAKWYGELFSLGQEVEPEYYFRYAQSLKAMDDFKKADEYLALFSQKEASDSRGKLYSNNKNYLNAIEYNSGRYSIESVEINTEYSDFGAAVADRKLVFSSARTVAGVSQIKSKWTNQSFLNLYCSKINDDGTLSKPEPFSKSLNSKVHESSAVFTKDGKRMYFTRNNFINDKKSTDGHGLVLLKLYKASNNNGKWEGVTELPFNSNDYSVAHPALSPDGKMLYFSSNMPGTIGSSDIFKVTVNADGTFGKPENLGASINTEGRETFPFVSHTNELYFSSEGHLGLGGLDIFVSKINPDGSFSKAVNVGIPVNSSQDDFAFYIDSDTKSGFFSSNREGGKGYDDIYKLTELKPLRLKNAIVGNVFDEESSEKLSNAKVTLLDETMKVLREVYTDSIGKYRFEEAAANKKLYIRVDKKDYETQELHLQTENDFGETVVRNPLVKSVMPIAVGVDLAKVLRLQPIYFDAGKSNIGKVVAVELAKIVQVMKEYPRMIVEVRSHTDSRESNDVNMTLSESRAKSTVTWIIKKGIDKSRISGKGYGESQLLNKCADGVPCSEEEHLANIRTEFIVIKM